MVSERDVRLDDGRTLHAYDGGGPSDAFTVLWHHGTPQTGAPLEPVLEAAARRGIRILSYGRPSYGGSSPQPGRTRSPAPRCCPSASRARSRSAARRR
jgi:pimeloyl-ACP methyl ester carboxylesterase